MSAVDVAIGTLGYGELKHGRLAINSSRYGIRAWEEDDDSFIWRNSPVYTILLLRYVDTDGVIEKAYRLLLHQDIHLMAW